MSSEALHVAKVFRNLLRAVKQHIGYGENKRHFSEFVTEEFRKKSVSTDLLSDQQRIKLARDYTFLLNSVHHHKALLLFLSLTRNHSVFFASSLESAALLSTDLLFSYNIAVDRSEEMKRTLGKSAANVGLQLPEDLHKCGILIWFRQHGSEKKSPRLFVWSEIDSDLEAMSRERPKRGVLPPAQQVCDTDEECMLYCRYVSVQRYSEALDLLHSGACIQLEHGQVTCGAELAVLYVDTLVKASIPYNNETLDCVRKIYMKFPQIPVPQHLGDDEDMQKISEALGAAKTRVDACSSFLKAAIKWSAEFGAPRYGSPELHGMLAEYVYSESSEVDMARVSYHFIKGNNPKKFASVLVNFMGKCYPGEDDLAIARAILMYLSSGNLRDSNQLMDELKKQVEEKQLDLPQSDLLQFIIFLLQTLQRDALPLFNMLKVKYKSSLDREPSFKELLDDIAEKFYGVRRKNPLQGMFGDIFKMMGAE
ncbi:hypothetical protein TIFTF001_020314 [Ficus carica]|uniref:Golgi to ER traffic protein 4 homolog n=1 Tax=Ficus carica TaxID=3494 RepID=A0AA88ADG1_FICCA|nr:hypothetical protein TIFTF001_020314 [Ficus carica]